VRLEEVFRDHQLALFAYFIRSTGSRDLAEELTQETFVRACSATVRYRGDAPVINWLFGIGHRVLLDASRKGAFRIDLDISEHDQAATQSDLEERMDLEHAFDRLPLPDREVLLLVDLLGFTPSDAAGLMGIDAATVRQRLHRARARIRTHLEVTHDG
jgi:RNA polymerase sigma-70 factor (ECF subfamily)